MRVSVLILALLISLVSPVCATVYYVDGDMSDDTGAGTTWATAKKTIQAAIDVASSGDEVWVKALSSGNYNEHIMLLEEVSLYGGFDGTESMRDDRDWTINITIIDASGLDNSVITAVSSITNVTRIDGFTIRNGTGRVSRPRWGGGIDCNGGSPTISNNIISNNTADVGGGIFATSGASPVIEYNTIQDNTGRYGCGILMYDGTVRHNTITGNEYVDDILGSTGGGIFLPAYTSSAIIEFNTVSNNTVQTGGGIRCMNSTPSIRDNTISDNFGQWDAGGIKFSSSGGEIVRNIISGNENVGSGIGNGDGGGIYLDADSAVLVASNIVTGNIAARYGGGIFCGYDGCDANIVSNTIVANTAGTDGGGIGCTGSAAFSIGNNIVSSNSSGIYKSGTCSVTLSHNDFYSNTSYNYSGVIPTNDISVDPSFVGGGDYHLQSNSPCMDAGDDSLVQTGWTDIDGEARLQNSHVDIGADEITDTIPPTFTDIYVVHAAACYGTQVSIHFTASETLSGNPTVTVNDHSATYSTNSGNDYAYTYTVMSTTYDPLGEATLEITGYDTAAIEGITETDQALWITSCESCDLGRFTYDKVGNRKTMQDERGTTVYFYDALNRLIKVVEPDGKWIAYEYDGNNNRTKMTTRLDSSTEHVTQYSYYDNGLLYQVTDQLDGVTTYTYYDNGLVDTITYPNGTIADHTYNSRNWLTVLENKKSDSTVIAKFTYSYDTTYWGKNGTRTKVIEDILKPDSSRISAQVDYEYDNLYRLVHEERTAYNGGNPGVAYEYNYAYDAAGNRTQWQVVGGTTTNYTYDAANKMTGPGTFTYDCKGNITHDGISGADYTWDLLNRLTQWEKTGETTQTYLYNADGMRVRITPSGGTATGFLLDGVEIAEAVTGNDVKSYVRPGLICDISSTTQMVYHADGVGSTRALTNSSEIVQEADIYDAYGNPQAGFVSGSVFAYAGEYRYYTDSTKLNYLKTRYYDPGVGRFVSRDSIGYNGGPNTYQYAMSRPSCLVDPSGKIAWIPILIGGWAIWEGANWIADWYICGLKYKAAWECKRTAREVYPNDCQKKWKFCEQQTAEAASICGANVIGEYTGNPIYGPQM